MIIREAEVEDLGPALAVEDALTVLVVILVLRVVLFVPLMSMDRARLEHAEKDDYWQGIYSRVLGSKQESKFTGQYEDAFDIGGKSTVVTSLEGDRVRYIEAADGNDNLLVIRHETGRQSYSSMFIQKFSTVPSYSHGQIKWSPQEKKWFTLNNRVDYAQTPESMALRKEYLEWARARGNKP